VLGNIQREFASPQAAEAVIGRVRAKLQELSGPRPMNDARIAQLDREIGNLIDAVAAVGVHGSIGLTERLRAAELERARLKAQAAATDASNVERLLPDLAARYTHELARLPDLAEKNIPRARTMLEQNLGQLQVRAKPGEIEFWGQQGHVELALLATAGVANKCGSGGAIQRRTRPGIALRA
jgi:hypothetical protein